MTDSKQLPAVVHPITDIYPNIALTSDCSSADAIAVNVCAPILFLAALQDDEEVRGKMDEYGIDADTVNDAAIYALEAFRHFMEFDE